MGIFQCHVSFQGGNTSAPDTLVSRIGWFKVTFIGIESPGIFGTLLGNNNIHNHRLEYDCSGFIFKKMGSTNTEKISITLNYP